MEKFMFIFQGRYDHNRSAEEIQQHTAKWYAWVERLRTAGRYITGDPLQPGGKLISGEAKSVTDGPFTEGKEVVGGFFLVNAENYDEAVEMAKDCPDLPFGGIVQVRQILKY